MQNPNKPSIRTIERVIDETPTVRTLVFSDTVLCNVLPGQFAMVWVPGIGELPMSVMVCPESGKAAFTVRKHGVASTGLFNMTAGDKIGVRGPYGNSFDIRSGRILLVGGGTGLVPLVRLLTYLKQSDDITILIGAKTRNEVFFENLTGRLPEARPHRTIISTEDGTYGDSGFVTDTMKNLCRMEKFDAAYVCGPEAMMYGAVQIADSKNLFIQASLERVMKCGVGICGSCCTAGDLVCHDGTIFDGRHLLANPEFGHVFRNKAGIPENYPKFQQGLK